LVVDLEYASVDEVASHLDGADAVVFAAGAGPGSGAARKETIDRDAAILLADAAEAAKVRRYVMISSIGADAEAPDDAGNPVFVAYLRAKGAADDNIRGRSALDSTIIRPGRTTLPTCGERCGPRTIRACGRCSRRSAALRDRRATIRR